LTIAHLYVISAARAMISSWLTMRLKRDPALERLAVVAVLGGARP